MDGSPLEVSGMGESRLGVSVVIDELAVEQDDTGQAEQRSAK